MVQDEDGQSSSVSKGSPSTISGSTLAEHCEETLAKCCQLVYLSEEMRIRVQFEPGEVTSSHCSAKLGNPMPRKPSTVTYVSRPTMCSMRRAGHKETTRKPTNTSTSTINEQHTVIVVKREGPENRKRKGFELFSNPEWNLYFQTDWL